MLQASACWTIGAVSLGSVSYDLRCEVFAAWEYYALTYGDFEVMV